MGYKNIDEDFGQFNGTLKITQGDVPYNKMSRGNNRTKYIQPDWMIKSFKYFDFDTLITQFNIKFASKRRFKNSIFQHPHAEKVNE